MTGAQNWALRQSTQRFSRVNCVHAVLRGQRLGPAQLIGTHRIAARMALTPGTRLGPYEIRVQIGVGGMGEVYQAIETLG